MRIIKIDKNKKIKKSRYPLVIGYFSCVHVMHNELLNLYHNFNVLTFNDTVFKKEDQIYPFKDRIDNLSKFPVVNCYVYDIDKGNITAEKFIQHYLKKINPEVIVVGSDFKFGSDQKGINELRKHFQVEMVAYHSAVSTKMIANLLKTNKVEEANYYLMSPYSYKGRWISGKRKGRTIGYRTINLSLKQPLFISDGTYAVNIYIGKIKYKGVAFYGSSATFNVDKHTLEVHVMNKKILPKNFFPTIIRNNLKVEFLKYIRSNKKFASANELKDQIKKDITVADKFFKENN